MKKNSIEIGGLYTAKVSGKVVEVRIETAATNGGWVGVNTATGKRIRIKTAQRLRRAVGGGGSHDAGAGAKTDEGGKKQAKAAKAPKAPKAVKAPKQPKPKRVSALDAAAMVLQKKGEAMRAQELIAAMAEQGLWTSPGGKTPHATLYAAILREINAKGKDARFSKVERGKFEFVG